MVFTNSMELLRCIFWKKKYAIFFIIFLSKYMYLYLFSSFVCDFSPYSTIFQLYSTDQIQPQTTTNPERTPGSLSGFAYRNFRLQQTRRSLSGFTIWVNFTHWCVKRTPLSSCMTPISPACKCTTSLNVRQIFEKCPYMSDVLKCPTNFWKKCHMSDVLKCPTNFLKKVS
jgi:hypothetical protein